MTMEITDSQKAYKAPQAKVIEVNIPGVLCQSGGINDLGIDPDGGGSFS